MITREICREAGAIILKAAYGNNTEPKEQDPLVRLIERMMMNFFASIVFLPWMVDGIPALKYLPNWFPGMSFMRTAKEWREITIKTTEIPYAYAKQQMETQSTQSSIVAQLVDHCIGGNPEHKLTDEDEEVIKYVAGALYGGGTETTLSSFSTFAFAMVKFPEV